MILRRILHPRRPRRFVAGLASFVLALSGVLIVVAVPANAVGTTRAFTPVFTTNTTGDVTIRGNTLETCLAGSTQAQGGLTCAATQAGGSQQNNNFFMTYVDTDGSTGIGASTFDSSTATVTIPTGASVLYAGLSWGATTGAGSLTSYPALTGVVAPNASLKTSALLQPPGASSYSTVTSTTTDVNTVNFQAFADVTSTVQAAGSGTYTVANVQAGTGGGNYAGWSLAVAYSAPTAPARNLVIFTGYNSVSTGTGGTPSVDIPVSGFVTPATGQVRTTVGAVSYEGDKGSTGDGLSVGSSALFNSLNPVNDVFNSTITDLNVAVTDRNPSYTNTLGFDIDRFDATGALSNGSTSTTIHLTTSSETYYPGMITFATDLLASALTATKTATDVNGGNLARNDVLSYSITVTNGGGDGATSTVLTDTVPVGTSYVAGSLVVGGTAVTDAPGDDTGDASSGNITARLGTGATSAAGGLLAPAGTSTVSFRVTVSSSVADGTILSNTASFSSNSQTTGTGTAGASNTATSAVVVPPLPNGNLTSPGEVGAAYSSGLSQTGGTGPYTWAVSAGTLPAGLTIAASTGLITGTPTTVGTSTFTLQITDANSRTGTKPQTIVVNAGPVVAFAPPAGEATVAYSAQPTVTGGTSPYTWSISTGTLPNGLSIDTSTGLISGTATAAGTTNVTVQATDAVGASATKAVSIVIVAVPAVTFTPPAGEATVAYSAQPTVSGGTGPFTWTVSAGTLPAGLSINTATGLISGTPTATGSTGISVQAVDANNVSATKTASIVIGPGPSIAFTPPTGEASVAYTAQPTASGGTGPYTWAVSAGVLPGGLSIDAATGAVTGTPTSAGTTNVTIQVTDANGATATSSRDITIVPPPSLSGTLATGEVTAPYSSGYTVSGGVGPYVWAILLGSLPPGLSLNTSTGLITGTPTVTISRSIRVVVTDANNRSAVHALVVFRVVAGPAVAFAPPTGEVGVAYTAQPTASSGSSPFSWTVSAGTLPDGLSISATTGAITGTPTAAGATDVTVRATDAGGGTATQTRTVTIVAAPALTFATPPAGELGAAYSDQLTFTGGVGPFTWSVSAGTLPAGLGLDTGTGLLSGTPTAPGSSTFAVRIVDANNVSDAKNVTLVVARITTSIALSAPTSVQFGTSLTISSTAAPTAAGGTVTFTDVPTSGPQSGTTVTLGTSALSGGAASLQIALPAFGVNTITAHYAGDATHAAADSSTTQVEVSAYAGEVIVTEFRSSGPAGANDSYVELYNTGATVPLAGIVISTSSGSTSTLPLNAGDLGTRRSYLVTGSAFSLGGVATSDFTTTLGTGGIKVVAPDTALTQTDAVGPGTGFHLGTGLAPMTGTPTDQYAWVRHELAGAPVDTQVNANDFVLVSSSIAPVGGVQPMLGSASPTGTADPYQTNAGMTSTLFRTTVAASAPPNRIIVTGPPRQLVIQRTITNTSGATITAAKVRVTALSELHGLAEPGVPSQPTRVANLRVVNPVVAPGSVQPDSAPAAKLTVDLPITDALGGGLNSTLTLPLPDGGLAPGDFIRVAFTFDIDTSGTFWFGYDVDATTVTTPDSRSAGRSAGRAARVTPRLTRWVRPADAGSIK